MHRRGLAVGKIATELGRTELAIVNRLYRATRINTDELRRLVPSEEIFQRIVGTEPALATNSALEIAAQALRNAQSSLKQ